MKKSLLVSTLALSSMLYGASVSAQEIVRNNVYTFAIEAEPYSDSPRIGEPFLLSKLVETSYVKEASGSKTIILQPSSEIESALYNIDRVASLASNSTKDTVALNVRYKLQPLSTNAVFSDLNILINQKLIKTVTVKNNNFKDLKLDFSKNILSPSRDNVIEFRAKGAFNNPGIAPRSNGISLDNFVFTVDQSTVEENTKPKKSVDLFLKGDVYQGNPVFVVMADGKVVLESSVGARETKFNVKVDQDAKVLKVFFTNDLYKGSGKDRNLKIQRVNINNKKVNLSRAKATGCRWNRVSAYSARLACGTKNMRDSIVIPLSQ